MIPVYPDATHTPYSSSFAMKKDEIYRILNEAYFSENAHERDSHPSFQDLVRNAKVFLDVGASLGQYTRLASQAMQGAEIIAVEADPVRFEELQRNCAVWAQQSGNRIRAIHAAAAPESGSVRFQTTCSNMSGGLIRHGGDRPNGDSTWTEVEVPALSLQALCADQTPDIIKMDIEGAELHVLRAASSFLCDARPRLVVELHVFPEVGGLENYTRTVSLMRGLGFRNLPFYGKSLFVPKTSLSLAESLRYQLRSWSWRLRRRVLAG